MNKIKEMNKGIFRDNLIMTIEEIIQDRDMEEENLRFKIIPVYEEKIVFNFETSLRFRKPSLLTNVETGYPPFKAII